MSLLLPDTRELRALATRIDAVAHTARRNGEHLRRRLAATHWSGPAARAFDLQAEIVLHALRTSANRLDDAADALRAHAGAVDHAVAMVTTTVQVGWGLAKDVVGSALDLVAL